MTAPGEQRLDVTLLGDLTLSISGRAVDLPASRKTRALFVYLLLSAKPVRRERLCELFFDIPDDPRAALRWSLSKIRGMLGPHADALDAGRERVALRVERFGTDVDALKRLMPSSGSHERSTFVGSPSPGSHESSTFVGSPSPSHSAAPSGLLPLPGRERGLVESAELAMEPGLPGLELAGCDAFNAWLAAERAKIDGVRARMLAFAAAAPGVTPEQARRFAGETELLGGRPVEILPIAKPADEPRLDQTIRYCFADDGVRIAYACTGEGPPLVKAANWLNHLELDWTGPVWGRLFRALSRDHKLVRYDERGNGLSDWSVDDLGFEAFVRDLETVVDSLGLDRFPLLGISQGCAVSIEYAARHPERVSKLILLGGYAAGWRHLAGAEEAAQREAVITLAAHGWGQDNPVYRQIFSQTFMPSASHEELDWFNDFQRRTASADNAVRFLRTFAEIDVRKRLADVRASTLVLHARGDQRVPIVRGQELAAGIPGASLVTLDTDNHIPLSREPATERIVDCIEAFLREPPPGLGGPTSEIRRSVRVAR